jgi:hypothetical protein
MVDSVEIHTQYSNKNLARGGTKMDEKDLRNTLEVLKANRSNIRDQVKQIVKPQYESQFAKMLMEIGNPSALFNHIDNRVEAIIGEIYMYHVYHGLRVGDEIKGIVISQEIVDLMRHFKEVTSLMGDIEYEINFPEMPPKIKSEQASAEDFPIKRKTTRMERMLFIGLLGTIAVIGITGVMVDNLSTPSSVVIGFGIGYVTSFAIGHINKEE